MWWVGNKVKFGSLSLPGMIGRQREGSNHKLAPYLIKSFKTHNSLCTFLYRRTKKLKRYFFRVIKKDYSTIFCPWCWIKLKQPGPSFTNQLFICCCSLVVPLFGITLVQWFWAFLFYFQSFVPWIMWSISYQPAKSFSDDLASFNLSKCCSAQDWRFLSSDAHWLQHQILGLELQPKVKK